MFESFASFFTTVQVVLIASGAAFVAGVVFSQKVKDWIKGVPSDLRSALKGVEVDVLGRIKVAQAAVVADILRASTVRAGSGSPDVVVEKKVALPPASPVADAQLPAAPHDIPAPAPTVTPLPSEAPPVTPAIT